MATTEVRPPAAAPSKRRPPRGSGTPPRWRERLLPKTVMGITVIVLAAAVGAAFSGVVLYSYYEYRLNKTENKVSKFINGFQGQYDQALKNISTAQDNAKAEINQQLEPLKTLRAEGDTLANLEKQAAPSMFFVHTLDEAGQPSVGSAFAVASDANQTFLVTSYNTVRASTKKPGPDLYVRQGNIQKLDFAPKDPPLKVGERVFAVSGLGAGGSSISEGLIGDISAAGIQHDAAIGPAFQGGPILDSNGKVIGVASRAYAPLNFSTDSVFFGVPTQNICSKILKCPNGSPTGAGDKR
jgi:hypothetical protein